jgi:hypothetical protein
VSPLPIEALGAAGDGGEAAGAPSQLRAVGRWRAGPVGGWRKNKVRPESVRQMRPEVARRAEAGGGATRAR